MAAPQYKPQYKQSYQRIRVNDYNVRNRNVTNIRPALKKRRVVKKKTSPVAVVFQFFFTLLFLAVVSPVYTDLVTRPVLKIEKYPAIKADINAIAYPTRAYLHNNHVLGVNLLSGVQNNKNEMQALYETYNLPDLENRLNNLVASYPKLQPSVFVWDYESGKFADIKANNVYSAASIIKLPVLIQTFKAIEAGMLNINDKISMTDYYKSEGSGSLQFKGVNAVYSIDDLARVMITESDNSATNMLLSASGGMNAMNSSLRKWGMKETRINDWLPDLAGTNVTTAREMATLLYNIDNPNFLTLASREKMVDYMGHVHNNRLIQAGLPSDAIFMHKTGDIGKMLGDAGIVYTPNGKKYIVVMLVNRPYNSPEGKDFIVKASSIVYNYMFNTNL